MSPDLPIEVRASRIGADQLLTLASLVLRPQSLAQLRAEYLVLCVKLLRQIERRRA